MAAVFTPPSSFRRRVTDGRRAGGRAGQTVAVQHRGSWFYIADDDQTSKATWGLLNILFAFQSASAQGKSPLLTLPIGK